MKQKELMIIGITAFIAAILSFVICNAIFGTPQKNPIKVPVVVKIDPTFPQVENDSRYNTFYNNQALNPTQVIQIGGSGNNQPFQGGQ